jgi:hypothetical protein
MLATDPHALPGDRPVVVEQDGAQSKSPALRRRDVNAKLAQAWVLLKQS